MELELELELDDVVAQPLASAIRLAAQSSRRNRFELSVVIILSLAVGADRPPSRPGPVSLQYNLPCYCSWRR